jgi:hypothetical protein
MNTHTEPLGVDRHDGATLCPMCRKEVLLETNFCPECGTPVDAAGVMDPLPTPARSKWAERSPLLLAICYAVIAMTQAYSASLEVRSPKEKMIFSAFFACCALMFGWQWISARRAKKAQKLPLTSA